MYIIFCDRFSSVEKAVRHPMSYLPFGDGPRYDFNNHFCRLKYFRFYRNCIGMRFALLEAKLSITKAIRLVEFRTCEKTDVSNVVLLIIIDVYLF